MPRLLGGIIVQAKKFCGVWATTLSFFRKGQNAVHEAVRVVFDESPAGNQYGFQFTALYSQQVKGVGTQIALTYILTLEDPHRFPKSREVGCFLGLRPGRDSGESQPEMHTTFAAHLIEQDLF